MGEQSALCVVVTLLIPLSPHSTPRGWVKRGNERGYFSFFGLRKFRWSIDLSLSLSAFIDAEALLFRPPRVASFTLDVGLSDLTHQISDG